MYGASAMTTRAVCATPATANATTTRGRATRATMRSTSTARAVPTMMSTLEGRRGMRETRAGGFSRKTNGGVVLATSAPVNAVDLRAVIEDLCAGVDLSEERAYAAMEALLDADPTQISAFLVLLRAKGETASEMAGLARAMQSRAVEVSAGDEVLDIVGTGGDDAGTVNISTGSCVLAAAAGAKVAKHGSRSVSSLCGSGDVLEALGVEIELGPESMKRCICLLYTSPSPRDRSLSRMPSSA